jgi:acyl-CoA thioester hydrolase
MSGETGPFARFSGRVRPEWVDYNQHFNMGYYLVAFDQASEEVTDAAGFTAELRAREGVTVFVVETHVIYRREVKPDQAFRVTAQILGLDEKRLHLWQTMYAEGDDAPAAFNETMMLCVRQDNPKATPWPAPVYAALKEMADAHARLPVPPEAGRRVSMTRGS